jgi:integrase
MGTQLTELIEKAVNCLEMIGLNPQSIADYRYRAFEPIAKRLLLLTNIEAKDIQIQEAFFTMQYQNEIISRQTYNWRIRGIRILCEVLETGTFSWKVFSKNEKIILPDKFEAALSSYLEEQTCCDKRKSSIESICRRFLQSVSTCTESITEIKPIHIRDFIVQISETRSKSMDDVISSLKGFFRHLCEIGLYENQFWRLLSAPRSREHKVLSSVNADEIMLILAAIDRENSDGKRDYAILQLAAVSGLRAGDIASLTLDDIDWRSNEIRIIQGKTSEQLALPIPHAVLAAIGDYILNARPNTVDRHVFVRHCAPYTSYHDGVSIACLFRKYQKKAGLKHFIGDGKTLHGLRRGLGTSMIENGIPVDTVAQVLGHKGIRATRQYIEVDLKKLRLCALGFDSLGGEDL